MRRSAASSNLLLLQRKSSKFLLVFTIGDYTNRRVTNRPALPAAGNMPTPALTSPLVGGAPPAAAF